MIELNAAYEKLGLLVTIQEEHVRLTQILASLANSQFLGETALADPAPASDASRGNVVEKSVLQSLQP
jgi:hypothetical protein